MKYFLLILLVFNLYAKDVLGKIDKFDLPELGIYNIKAKIDTGAKTSSLRCTSITPINNNFVQFISSGKHITKPISRVSYVKSSNGKSEKRFFINTTIEIYNKIYALELSLSSRKAMIYPLLIGRELLNQGFVVDTSKKYLSYGTKNK